MVELLCGAHQADRPLLDQVEERQALVAVVLGDRDDQPQVGLDHVLLGAVVAALDALRELDLLRRRQQLDAPDLAQEQRERVDGGVAIVDLERELGQRVVDELDVCVLERAQDLVDLGRLEVQLVERSGDLVMRHESSGDAALDQQPSLFEAEHGYGRLSAHNVLLFAVIRDTPFDLNLARLAQV
jgi:hypothetical protein